MLMFLNRQTEWFCVIKQRLGFFKKRTKTGAENYYLLDTEKTWRI